MIDLKQLTSSLADYSSSADKMATLIAATLRPIAVVLIMIFFLFEMLTWYEFFKREQATPGVSLWLEMGIKYLLAFLFVQFSDQVFDSVLWFFNGAAGKLALLSKNSLKANPFEVGNVKGIIKTFVQLVGYGVTYIQYLVTKLTIFMRFFYLYLFKGIGPLMIASFMSDKTRFMCMNLIKSYGAYALNGVVIIIVILLYPAIVTDDLVKMESGQIGGLEAAFGAIAKGIILIMVVMRTNKISKQLMGVG